MEMMSSPILYGTKNPAKLAVMRRNLAPLGLQVIGLSDLSEDIDKLPVIEENGSTPLENARLKALAYYQALKRPVFSADSGLYFEEVPEELQPGVYVRRRILPDGSAVEMSDEEMTDYYSQLADTYGVALPDSDDPTLKILHAYYYNGVCFVYDEEHIYEKMSRDLSGENFYLCNKPHEKYQKGFPLDRLSLQPASGCYYYDLMDHGEAPADDLALANGHREFFSEILQSLQ